MLARPSDIPEEGPRNISEYIANRNEDECSCRIRVSNIPELGGQLI